MKSEFEVPERDKFLEKWKFSPADTIDDASDLSDLFEACKLGDTVFLLPALVFELDRTVLASLFSQATWDALDEADRQRLRKFLPTPPSANPTAHHHLHQQSQQQQSAITATSAGVKAWQDATLTALFDQKRTDFPLVTKFVDDLYNGQYNASVVKYKEKIKHYRSKTHLINLKNYQLMVMGRIIQRKKEMNLPVEKDLQLYYNSMKLEHPNEELLAYLDVFKRKVEAERNKRLLQKNKKFRTDWYKFLQDSDSDQEADQHPQLEEDAEFDDFMKQKKKRKVSSPKAKEVQSSPLTDSPRTKKAKRAEDEAILEV